MLATKRRGVRHRDSIVAVERSFILSFLVHEDVTGNLKSRLGVKLRNYKLSSCQQAGDMRNILRQLSRRDVKQNLWPQYAVDFTGHRAAFQLFGDLNLRVSFHHK